MMNHHERILVYAMQSSGASLFAFFLAQIPSSIAIVDLWNQAIAPALRSRLPIIVKAVVTEIPLARHLSSFRPTNTILFIRDPVAIATSLASKHYRDEGGTIDFKLATLDDLFAERKRTFDLTVSYESLLVRAPTLIARLRAIGIHLPPQADRYIRPPEEILHHNCERVAWCRRHYGHAWGFGGLRPGAEQHPPSLRAQSDVARGLAERHAPALVAYYRAGSHLG